MLNETIMELPFEQYKNIKIEEVCRICLKKENIMGLIADNNLINMLLDCASIKVSNIR